MKSVRLWYKKSGLAIYTSHLDMNRCLTRAVRLAGVPLWYTEGFNPHPYMTFLLPLPLGQTGIREPIDIKIESDMDDAEIKEKLNAVLPGGVEIVDVTQAECKSNEIVSAKYEICIEFESEGEAEGFSAGITDIMESGELKAEKRTKKGPKTVNLCDYVKSFKTECRDNAVRIETVLATGTAENLNAALLIDTLCGEFAADPVRKDIVRTEIYIDGNRVFR